MHGHEDKGSRYIAQIDAARVNGSWSELPELLRKIQKHASGRQILIQTATAELQIIGVSPRASVGAPKDNVAFTKLSEILQARGEHEEEDYIQGITCLLWAQWCGVGLPADTQQWLQTEAGKNLVPRAKSVSTWTKICMVKRTYIEGILQVRQGKIAEGKATFAAAVDAMQADRNLVLSTPQLAYWSEQLLARLALTDGDNQAQTQSTTNDAAHLAAFNYWSIIVTKTKEVPASTYKNNPQAHLNRFQVWEKYYESLSTSIRGNAISPQTRVQQSTELRKVERAYENQLLSSLKFPKAAQSNQSVELWVEQVITNWHFLCGTQWRDSDLGEGGRNAVTRNVLDVLYRAATKTFHSQLILRRLFQVHKSLAEFDLAYKALDTYIDLVERSWTRAAKSQSFEPGQESNDTFLATVAEGVEGLCSFGRQNEARKAYELCLKLESRLVSLGAQDNDDYPVNGQIPNGHIPTPSSESAISPTVLQLVYRAVGIGKAHWARWTPFNEYRTELQSEALTNLKKACSQQPIEQIEVETLYATGLLLAETRNISQAIAYVKQALAKGTSSGGKDTQWSLERKSIPLWHLLALLLSSRDEYENSITSCSAAFEQFKSSAVLFGNNNSDGPSVISSEKHDYVSEPGLVKEMECDELQRIIEIRITELALTELIEGPEEAVNCSDDLLGLYARIFAHLQVPYDPPGITRNTEPPKSSAGTLKSTKGSIFSRAKNHSSVGPISEKAHEERSIMTDTTRPSTQATQAPTIQVTDEEGKSPKHRHHIFRASYEKARESKTSFDGSARKLVRGHSQKKHNGTNSTKPVSATKQDPNTASTIPSTTLDTAASEPIIPLEHEKSADSKQPLPNIGHNLGQQGDAPAPISHSTQPLQQDVRLPTLGSFTNATSPPPRFSKSATQKHALTILTKIWLVVAKLYRRASMYDDSKEACEEAGKAASKIEALVGAIDHSARTFADPGWGGGGRSVDEIWADIYCERAELELAVYERRHQEGQHLNNDGLRIVVEHYEQCLMYSPNHTGGIIGLSNLLLDHYEKKVDLSKRIDNGQLKGTEVEHAPTTARTSLDRTVSTDQPKGPETFLRGTSYSSDPITRTEDDLRKTPENLNRIAARDRAYGLLSTLTKLGNGWDNAEAWYALARAHELGGELEKAKSILWWCIELEDSRPIRHWRNLGYSM